MATGDHEETDSDSLTTISEEECHEGETCMTQTLDDATTILIIKVAMTYPTHYIIIHRIQ